MLTTHIIVSLLYAWKVAVVRTDYDYTIFLRHFKKVYNRNCFRSNYKNYVQESKDERMSRLDEKI